MKGKKELDDLWSKIIRTRDKECQWCGKKTSLQAHHIIPKGRCGFAGRYHLENGMCLCYRCHFFEKLSRDVDFTRFLEKWLHDRDIDYDQLNATFHQKTIKFTKDFYEQTKQRLSCVLDSLV